MPDHKEVDNNWRYIDISSSSSDNDMIFGGREEEEEDNDEYSYETDDEDMIFGGQKDTKKKGIVHSNPLKPIDFDYSRKKSYGMPSGTSCLICMDVFPTLNLHVWPHPNKKSKCYHPVCMDCFKSYVMQKFRESDFGEEMFIKCPKDDCNDMMTPFDLERVIPQDVLQRWRDAIKLRNTLPTWSYHSTPLMSGWPWQKRRNKAFFCM
nr:hypothetical protein [Tanacetum cinerariifolium]